MANEASPESLARTELLTIRGRGLGLAASEGMFFPSRLAGCLLPATPFHSCSWLLHDGLEHKGQAKVVSHDGAESFGPAGVELPCSLHHLHEV